MRIVKPYSGAFFKYRGFDSPYAEAMLTRGEVYFAPPSELNDPFELRPHLSNVAMPKIRRDLTKQAFSNLGVRGTNSKLLRKRIQATAELKKTLGSPDDLKREFWRAVDARNGILSGSTISTSIQQWTYYARAHTGFAVEFDIPAVNPPFVTLLVRYSDVRPDVDAARFFGDPRYQSEAGISVMTVKHSGWQHEKEVRGIKDRNGKEFIPDLLRGVYLGVKCSDANEARVKGWIRASARHMTLYRMKADEERFGLIAEEIA